MPMIDLTFPADTFTPEQQSALADELTTVILRAEGAPDTEFFRNITWVFAHELPREAVFVAGRPASEPIFRVQVNIPAGALNDRRKEQLVADATKTVLDAAGLTEQDALRVWVLINEVTDGNWGAGGNVIRIEQLRGFAASERDAQTVSAGA
jgi:phenylpyruvate tautomerase PptA (4-oxalocrotonate tautomerase family)